jgi:HAE1 family hydrophobic/amphiphilic exporter-1
MISIASFCRRKNGSTVKFSDVGRVVDTVEEIRSVARVDGDRVTLSIQKQTGTNTVKVVDDVLKKLETIADSPSGYTDRDTP